MLHKIFAPFALICSSLYVNAQVQFGVTSGVNFSRYLAKFENKVIAGINFTPGFFAGGYADINLTDNFFLQPNLLINLKRASADNDIEESRIRSVWLDVPILCSYKFMFGDNDCGFRVDAGPLFDICFGGHEISRIPVEDDTQTQSTLSSSLVSPKQSTKELKNNVFDEQEVGSTNVWRRLNFGLCYGGSFFFQRFAVGILYDWGFLNLWKANNDAKLSFNTLKIRACYTF